jgi:hypothetical protein
MQSKTDKDDISALLGTIATKRNDLPKSPMQEVRPIEPSATKKADKRENVKTAKRLNDETRGVGGRPTYKRDDIEYVKISPRIPKSLKQQIEIALIQEHFRDGDGMIIKTMDELTAHALEKLLS